MSSETNVVTVTLRTLHRMHRQLSDLNEQLERGPRLLAAQEVNIDRSAKQLAEAEGQAKAVRMSIDKKQLQLDSGETGVQRRRLQLQQANDNREYQALKEQIAADEMANSVLADEILEAMEKMDLMTQKVAEAKAILDRAKQDAETLARDFQEKEPKVRGEIERIQAEAKASEAELPSDFRLLYNRLVKGRGEDALAPVVGEYCGGCNHHIPVNIISALMLATPIQCKSCGRLLYLPEHYEAH